MFENGDRQPRKVAGPPRARGKGSRDAKRPRTDVELLTEISARNSIASSRFSLRKVTIAARRSTSCQRRNATRTLSVPLSA
jgi:hypothetical protein